MTDRQLITSLSKALVVALLGFILGCYTRGDIYTTIGGVGLFLEVVGASMIARLHFH